MDQGFWKLFTENGDPVAYLMCVRLERETKAAQKSGEASRCRKPQEREDMPPMPEA